jgi:protein SCO1/2
MNVTRFVRITYLLLAVLVCAISLHAQPKSHPASGLVLKIDKDHKRLLVSCQEIRGFMPAMTMPVDVRDSKEFDGLQPGTVIEFTLISEGASSHARNIIIRRYQSTDQDPLTASRLRFLNQITSPSAEKPLSLGQAVPDFALIDQHRQRTALSQFSGKVVAINFIYTSCALPQYCYRSSNNFGVLQRRFRDRLSRDLVLLTITFDPARDQPDVLAQYASKWKADAASWHFLTGAASDIQRVTALFGVDFFPSEGFMDHSLHTAIIDRKGKLVANIEGNQFTPEQLGDLIATQLSGPKSGGGPNH